MKTLSKYPNFHDFCPKNARIVMYIIIARKIIFFPIFLWGGTCPRLLRLCVLVKQICKQSGPITDPCRLAQDRLELFTTDINVLETRWQRVPDLQDATTRKLSGHGNCADRNAQHRTIRVHGSEGTITSSQSAEILWTFTTRIQSYVIGQTLDSHMRFANRQISTSSRRQPSRKKNSTQLAFSLPTSAIGSLRIRA